MPDLTVQQRLLVAAGMKISKDNERNLTTFLNVAVSAR